MHVQTHQLAGVAVHVARRERVKRDHALVLPAQAAQPEHRLMLCGIAELVGIVSGCLAQLVDPLVRKAERHEQPLVRRAVAVEQACQAADCRVKILLLLPRRRHARLAPARTSVVSDVIPRFSTTPFLQR